MKQITGSIKDITRTQCDLGSDSDTANPIVGGRSNNACHRRPMTRRVLWISKLIGLTTCIDIEPSGKFGMGRIDPIIIDTDPNTVSQNPSFPNGLDVNHIIDPGLSRIFGIRKDAILIVVDMFTGISTLQICER